MNLDLHICEATPDGALILLNSHQFVGIVGSRSHQATEPG
jgi:hypothetical protein